MPLASYDGNTFVAFLDISGFKKMMPDRAKAVNALDAFYQAGYDVLRDQPRATRVDGLFVSDCGVLFVRAAEVRAAHLDAILGVVEAINSPSILSGGQTLACTKLLDLMPRQPHRRCP